MRARPELLRALRDAALSMERKRSPTMINLPRALFAGRTGREARYHTSLAGSAAPDWAYGGGKLVPLKGYPWRDVNETIATKAEEEAAGRSTISCAGRSAFDLETGE
jgi:hypothetical protein